jgi:serine/threonine protein kinase
MKAIANYLVDGEAIGEGQFGKVHLCHLKTDPAKTHFAVKVIKKASLTPRLFNNLKNEINILTKIASPHVIRLHDV